MSKPSILSSRPPWPGMMSDASFSPAARFKIDSPKSPIRANSPIPPETGIASHGSTPGTSIQNVVRTPARIPAMTPPIAPSTVFPGLILGANFRFPNVLPVNIAAISFAQTTMNKKKMVSTPFGNPLRIAINPPDPPIQTTPRSDTLVMERLSLRVSLENALRNIRSRIIPKTNTGNTPPTHKASANAQASRAPSHALTRHPQRLIKV